MPFINIQKIKLHLASFSQATDLSFHLLNKNKAFTFTVFYWSLVYTFAQNRAVTMKSEELQSIY